MPSVVLCSLTFYLCGGIASAQSCSGGDQQSLDASCTDAGVSMEYLPLSQTQSTGVAAAESFEDDLEDDSVSLIGRKLKKITCENLKTARDEPWVDSAGDTCDSIAPEYCDYDYDFEVDGVIASGACCGCGGGFRSEQDKKAGCTSRNVLKNRGPVQIYRGHCGTKTDTRGLQRYHPKRRMMFVGDSDIEYWKTEHVFKGSVNCGVGGATAWEAAAHAKSIANKILPKRFVVFVSGENDFGSYGASHCAHTVFEHYKKAANAFIHSKHKPKVIYMGTKPEPGTKKIHANYKEYDALVKEYAAGSGGRVIFVDVYNRFLDMGNPKSLYQKDDLHMSKLGYNYWNHWVKNAMEGCDDLPGSDGSPWKDKDGDDCVKIVNQKWCQYADDYKNDGKSAKDACCGCFDGNRGSP